MDTFKAYTSFRILPGNWIFINCSTRCSESLFTWINCSTVSKLSRSCSLSSSCIANPSSTLLTSGDLSDWREDCRESKEPTGDFGELTAGLPDAFTSFVTIFGVLGGVVCGESDALLADSLVSALLTVLDLWNGDAMVVAAVDTRSTGKAITFLNAIK